MKQKVKLKDIASYSKGSQINGTELIENGEFDYLNGGINPSGKWNEANCNADTIAISEGGNSCGYVNYMRKPFWCGAHCYYLYDTVANTKYLYYALKSQQERIMKLRSGACMPNIKKSDLGNFEFIFDDDDKQQKNTTDILNKIERVIELRQKEILYLDELVKARFVEMFGDVIINYKNFQTNLLGNISNSRLGKMLDSKNTNGDKLYPYLANFNIQWFHIVLNNLNEMDFSEKDRNEFKLLDGDVLVCEGGEIGRCAIWRGQLENCYFQKALHRIRCNPKFIIPDYLVWWFKFMCEKEFFDTVIGGKATIPHLTGVKLKNLNIVLPPIELQNQFADFVQQVDKSKSAIKKSLEETQILFDSLMQKYFG